MQVVINACYGGFGLSHKAVLRYAEIKGMTLYPWIDSISKQVYKDTATFDNPHVSIHYSTAPLLDSDDDMHRYAEGMYFYPSRAIARDDPVLIQVIRELGTEANGEHAELKIIDIPDGIEYEIQEYDGNEHIAEAHRTWA